MLKFRRIRGVEGIYIANQWHSSSEGQWQTLISHNRGAEWETLAPPSESCVRSTRYLMSPRRYSTRLDAR